MMTRIPLVVLVLIPILSSPAFPGTGDASPPEAGPALFQRMERAAADVETVSSGFVQEKRLAVFQRAISSKGRFLFRKPDRLRWEYTEPTGSGFVLNGNRGRRWNDRTGESESFDIRRDPIMRIVSEQILAWAKPDFPWLRKEYRIRVLAERPLSLRLEPRSAPAAGAPDHLRILFSPDDRYVRTVEIHEKDGDSTVLRFVDTVVNAAIPPERFE